MHGPFELLEEAAAVIARVSVRGEGQALRRATVLQVVTYPSGHVLLYGVGVRKCPSLRKGYGVVHQLLAAGDVPGVYGGGLDIVIVQQRVQDGEPRLPL